MRFTRLVTGLAAAGLLAASPLLVGTAATAATPVATSISIDPLDSATVDFGDQIFISGDLNAADGGYITNATVTLLVSTPAAPTFTPIATYNGNSFFFSGIKPAMNSTYEVSFAGTSDSTHQWTASTSAPFSVSVDRTITAASKNLRVFGKVKPDFGKKKLKILQVVSKKKTKKFKTIKTSKSGKYVFQAPNRVGFKFIVVVPGDAFYGATTSPVYTVVRY